MGGAGAIPPALAPTPSVALFPSSAAAPPSSFHSPLPSRLPSFPTSKTPVPLLTVAARNRAASRAYCGRKDGLRCGKGLIYSPPPFSSPLLPSTPALAPRTGVCAARTLATTSYIQRVSRCSAAGAAGQRRALSAVLECVPDSPRPCPPAAAAAMRGGVVVVVGGAC